MSAQARQADAVFAIEAPDTADAAKSARAVATGHEGDANRLREYWTRGEGLAKWRTSPHPWTALYHHLLKHIKNVDEAKRTAASWYHQVFGTWPGAGHGGHK